MLPVVALRTIGDVAEIANVPAAFGKVSVGVPAAACATMVADPEEAPGKIALVNVPAKCARAWRCVPDRTRRRKARREACP
jgi:hypothetical protein